MNLSDNTRPLSSSGTGQITKRREDVPEIYFGNMSNVHYMWAVYYVVNMAFLVYKTKKVMHGCEVY